MRNALLEQDLREVMLKVNQIAGRLGTGLTDLGARGPLTLTNFTPPVITQGISTPSQLRNGDFSHSFNTWFDAAPAGNDRDKECAWWFSNDAPVNGQLLDFSYFPTSPNKTLKYTTESTYDPAYSDWDLVNGFARLTGVKSLDTPLPSNTAVPSRTMCVPFILALLNEFIVVPDECRIYAGIWDNTAGQLDWIHANAAFSFLSNSRVVGTPAVTTTRKYKVYAKTDRGYTFLSAELTLAGAPDDASFVPNEVYVALSWESIAGILEYDVYRHNVTAATYELLEQIGNGSTTYIDQNSVDKVVAGYPTATDDRAKAYVATQAGDLQAVAVNGVSSQWNTFFLNIAIPGGPNGYFQSVTIAEQVLRMGLTMPLDRRVNDAVVTSGDPNVTSVKADLTSLDDGRTVIITKDEDTLTTQIDVVTNEHSFKLVDTPTFDAVDAELYIVEGGDHGLLIDLVHLSYVPNAVYAPYPDDLNRIANGGQQPIAAPNGSSQGGIGTGGSGEAGGGGGERCVIMGTKVLAFVGNEIKPVRFEDLKVGDALYSGGIMPNHIVRIKRGREEIFRVQTKNGCQLFCSPSHRLITGYGDTTGKPVAKIQAGDTVLTWMRGRIERSPVIECETTSEMQDVGTLSLEPGHLFITNGFVCHNLKPSQSNV